jgi:hypothetical protein
MFATIGIPSLLRKPIDWTLQEHFPQGKRRALFKYSAQTFNRFGVKSIRHRCRRRERIDGAGARAMEKINEKNMHDRARQRYEVVRSLPVRS